MGCNGNNHPPGCDCGWGGINHGGSRGGAGRSPLLTSGVWLGSSKETGGETRPTTCPYCGAAVYFFRDQNGGSAFFDELGSPWPKHPCFDMEEPRSGRFAPVDLPRKVDFWGTPYLVRWPSGPRGPSELKARIVAVRPSDKQQTILFETSDPDLSFFIVTDHWKEETIPVGYIRLTDNVGEVAYRPDRTEVSFVSFTGFGPCFECFSHKEWTSVDVSSPEAHLVAQDLSENRWRTLGGTFFKPEWRYALDPHIDILLAKFDPAQLISKSCLFTSAATDIISHARKQKIRQLLNNFINAEVDEQHSIYDEIIEILAEH